MAKNSLFIQGNWRAGRGESLVSENPCTGERIWSGAAAAESDVDAAVGAARGALEHWALLSLAQRIALLREYQRILQENKASLADTIALETGKPTWEAQAEVASMIGKVDLSIEAYETRSGETAKTADGVCSRVRHKPHGVIAVFGPYNFPGHLPNGHIVPALLAGNSIVFKPSEQTPRVAEHMTRLLSLADFPAGVINLVQGARRTGIALARHDGIDGLFFTGSSRTGQGLHRQFAGDTRRILALEMGGNNPLIVHEAWDLSAAVYLTLQSAYITAGQRCTCARRLIVPRGGQGDAFIERLLVAIDGILVGCPDAEPEPFMGPVISNTAAQDLLNAQAELARVGGRTLRAMRRILPGRPGPERFPARQTCEASQAIARLHGLSPARTVFAQQHPAAIDAGVFHNDVIALGHRNVFFCHENAFLDQPVVLEAIADKMAPVPMRFIEVPAAEIPLQTAVGTYLFNSQLIDISAKREAEHFIIVAPLECERDAVVRHYLDSLLAADNPVKSVHYVDLRQSMRNGGGPACLRLRVVMHAEQIQCMRPRVFMDDGLYDKLSTWVEKHYRENLSAEDLRDPRLLTEIRTALDELTQLLRLGSVYDFQRL